MQYVLGIRDGEFNPDFIWGKYIHEEVEYYHRDGEGASADIARYTDVYEASDYVEVEYPFTWNSPIIGLPFTGIIDRMDTALILHDLKTSKCSWSQRKADDDIQATAYLAWNYSVSETLNPFTFDILRKDKRANGGEFPLQSVTTTRTKQQLLDFEYFCAKALNDMAREREYRCNCYDGAHKLWEATEVYA